MFELPNPKLFRDVVHGYIKVPRCFVDYIIDTAMFQRLRNIDQTGMRVLYPDAKHDRFGHSLGVFHLGCQAVDALLANFRYSSESDKSKFWFVRSDDSLNAFWAKNKVLFLIACLLHDIGHAPFSHSLENEMHEKSGAQDFDRRLAELLKVEYEDLIEQKPSAHEKMGAFLVLMKFEEPIKNILDFLSRDNYPRRHQSALVTEPATDKSFITADDIEDDMRFISRMILGLKYLAESEDDCFTPEKQIKNCFIELLNGNNFDVDKLDYIIRDTHNSGMKNTGIDVERLLNAINIVTLTKITGSNPVSERFKKRTLIQAVAAKKTSSTITMDGYIDGTFVLEDGASIEVAVDSVIRSGKKSEHSDGDPKIIYDSDTKLMAVNADSRLVEEGKNMLNRAEDGQAERFGRFSTKEDALSRSMREVIVKDKDLKLAVKGGSFEFIFKGKCRLKIKGCFYNEAPVIIAPVSPGQGFIEGSGLSLTIVDDIMQEIVPSKEKYNTFSVGFSKSAVGNISAVLDARDNLYKWIYAHHKVMYYANFLIPCIARAKLSDDMKCPIEQKDMGNLLSVDDAFFWTRVKKEYRNINDASADGVSKLIAEVVERKYKYSLFKSLPEYDVLFETLTNEQKKNMFELFKNNIDCTHSIVNNKYAIKKDEQLPGGVKTVEIQPELTAGFVKNDFINEIFGEKTDHGVLSLVWLAAQYKRVKIDLNKTYLIYKYDTTALSRIDLLSNALTMQNNDTSYYFYLFFDTKSEKKDDVRKSLSYAIVNYFSK